jgi:hypothetical protein
MTANQKHQVTKNMRVFKWSIPFIFDDLGRGVSIKTDVSALQFFPYPQMLDAMSHKIMFKQIQRMSSGYSTFSSPSNKSLMLPGFDSTIALETSSRNCVHNHCLSMRVYQASRIPHHLRERVHVA